MTADEASQAVYLGIGVIVCFVFLHSCIMDKEFSLSWMFTSIGIFGTILFLSHVTSLVT